jgi:hypothetical protein
MPVVVQGDAVPDSLTFFADLKVSRSLPPGRVMRSLRLEHRLDSVACVDKAPGR